MKIIVAVLLVSLAVAAFAQAPGQATGQAATAGATAGATPRRGGLGNLLTLGVLTGRMGGDAMRDMMTCQMMGLNPIFCMGMM